MADNYLERRMEEYRSGRLAARPRTHTSLPADALILRYPLMSVLVLTDGSEFGAVLVAELRRAGLRVSFIHPDTRVGTALSQTLGSRFYPASMTTPAILADMAVRRSPADVILVPDGSVPANGGDLPVMFRYSVPEGVDAATAARVMLFALHPDNRPLLLADAFPGLCRVS